MGHMSIIHLIFQKIKDNSTQWDRPIPEIKGIAREEKGPSWRAAAGLRFRAMLPPSVAPLSESSRLQESHLHQRLMIPRPFPWRCSSGL